MARVCSVKVSANLTNVGSLAVGVFDLVNCSLSEKLTNIIHLTLKITSAQVVETSVSNNSSFQNYTHPDDHTIRTTDTPRFKPFTI